MANEWRLLPWSSRISTLALWSYHSGYGVRGLPLHLPVIPVLLLSSQWRHSLNTGHKEADGSFGALWGGFKIFGFIWSEIVFIWNLLSLSINGSPDVLVMRFCCRMTMGTILQWNSEPLISSALAWTRPSEAWFNCVNYRPPKVPSHSSLVMILWRHFPPLMRRGYLRQKEVWSSFGVPTICFITGKHSFH